MSDSAVATPKGKANQPRPEASKNIFGRIALFVRQVIAELKKVVSPGRSELLKLTGVVLVFVLIVMVFVGVLDFLIGLGVRGVLG